MPKYKPSQNATRIFVLTVEQYIYINYYQRFISIETQCTKNSFHHRSRLRQYLPLNFKYPVYQLNSGSSQPNIRGSPSNCWNATTSSKSHLSISSTSTNIESAITNVVISGCRAQIVMIWL